MIWDEKWADVDGRKVFYRAWQKHDGRPTLIHAHGFAISGTYLLPTAELLTYDSDIVVPDLPGQGRSEKPPTPLTIIERGGSVGASIDASGLERASFIGNSMGCAITIECTDLFPDRIDHAVPVSPAGGPHSQPLVRAIGQMARDGVREPPRIMTVATPDYLRFGPINALRLLHAMARFPAVERLLAMHVPTLAVLGQRDPLTEVVRRFVLDVPLVRIEGIDVLKQAGA